VTVLAEYQRLESEGIWRATPEAQRRDVVVSIGEATLTINAPNGTALAHWSLPAVVRFNPGETPAVFGPGAEPRETLEITDAEMIDAMDRVLGAIRRRSRGGRWFGKGTRLLTLVAILAVLAFWLPGAITAYTARLVPPVAQVQIGQEILAETERLTGAPCSTPAGSKALQTLADRLFPGGGTELVILPSTLRTTAHVPGGTILISHTLVEDHETPDVVAGFAIAEHLRARSGNSLGELLEASPFRASLALLSTGHLREIDLQRMAEWLLIKPPSGVPQAEVIMAMRERGVATAPYGYALDISGETTAPYLAQDSAPEPILDDSDWVALQSICSG
jgi:hypothetical protein